MSDRKSRLRAEKKAAQTKLNNLRHTFNTQMVGNRKAFRRKVHLLVNLTAGGLIKA